MPTTTALLDSFAFILLIYVVRRFFTSNHRGSLPPGPPGWPLIGNLFDMPTQHQWQTFAQWGLKWGTLTILDIVYLYSLVFYA